MRPYWVVLLLLLLLLDGFQMASGYPKMAQDGSKKLQDGPEMDQEG